MGVPTNCRYTKDHEWARAEGAEVCIGITDYAQHSLGDVVFIDLPKVGAEVTAGSSMATVESVKAVSDIYAPVTGRITKVNPALADKPELVNQDPHGAAWMVVIQPIDAAQLSSLMEPAVYDAHIAELSK